MTRTKTGKAINATALNLEGAKTVGVDVAEIYARTMGISAAWEERQAPLISPIMTITPFIGGPLVGKAFVVAILGGLGGTMGALPEEWLWDWPSRSVSFFFLFRYTRRRSDLSCSSSY